MIYSILQNFTQSNIRFSDILRKQKKKKESKIILEKGKVVSHER